MEGLPWKWKYNVQINFLFSDFVLCIVAYMSVKMVQYVQWWVTNIQINDIGHKLSVKL